jgi:D-alanine-D-alanine ligase
MGGVGGEREISIQSGRCVAGALREAGLNVVASDIAPDKLSILDDKSIDVLFLALHGQFGEDGQLQQILEDRSLVYTGSGPEASRLAFDKMAGKKLFLEAGVGAPKAVRFEVDSDEREIQRQLSGLGEKLVIKPIRQGSTLGVSIVDSPEGAVSAAQQCLREFGDCMIEEYIAGKEITVGILDKEPLPVIEIKSDTGFYDYQAKYLDERTQYLFDTLEASLEADIQRDALVCFNALGLRHFARIDAILGGDGRAYMLEANTLPGMTSHSLLPKAAVKTGLSMSQLCSRIVQAALKEHKSLVS